MKVFESQKRFFSMILSVFAMMQALSSIFFGISSIDVKAADSSWTFDYTGNVQEFTAPYTGKYYIEMYGAGKSGGHTVGYINLVENQTIYIGVGEKGVVNGNATFGGGGAGGNGAEAGGGASFITTRNRGDLYNFRYYRSEIIAVAGGGGGHGSLLSESDKVGSGGGDVSGGMGHDSMWVFTAHDARNATQTSGYNFGKGQDYCSIAGTSGTHGCSGYGGAGGGGLYGGYQGKCGYISGAGGSGYINRKILYQDDSYTEMSLHNGNGIVTLKWIGEVYTDLVIDTNGHGSYNGQKGKVTLNNKYGQTIDM